VARSRRWPARWPTRAAVTALVSLGFVMALAPTAAAHTRAAEATSYRSEIEHAPSIPGVEWRVYAGGTFTEVTNRSGQTLVVLGYENEPYVRVGPEGVFENRNSPATYLNAERYGDVAVPPRADPAAEPEWRRVADGDTHAWHDHRVHWMSPELPPVVAASPGREHLVFEWAVPFRHAGQDGEVTGSLAWVPGPPVWPWLLAGLALTLPAAAGLLRGHRAGPGLVRPAAAVVAAVAMVNTIHFVDELLAWPYPTLDVIFGVGHTLLFVGVGLCGAAVAWHGRYGPHLSLGVAAGAVLFHQGLLQVQMLGSSELPTIWPPALLRLAVALSVGQAVWVALVLARGVRAGAEPDRAQEADTDRPGRLAAPALAGGAGRTDPTGRQFA
jgi:hypothetical protein